MTTGGVRNDDGSVRSQKRWIQYTSMRNFTLGVVATLVFFALAGYAAVTTGSVPANADSPPSAIEKWAARRSLHNLLQREGPKLTIPIANTDENIIAGIHLYAENCAVCHGASDARPSAIAKGLYQHAPQLAKNGVEDDPEGKIFWQAKHGIRLTGMPAFGASYSDDELWKVTLFLKHMDALTPRQQAVWKAVPPSAKT